MTTTPIARWFETANYDALRENGLSDYALEDFVQMTGLVALKDVTDASVRAALEFAQERIADEIEDAEAKLLASTAIWQPLGYGQWTLISEKLEVVALLVITNNVPVMS
jgi:hypothetical protein